MSDYMFMLESHLSADQNRVVVEVREAAAHTNMNLFLTGGAMRDMLGGFPVRDLDFTVEGNALKLVKELAKQSRVKVLATDENRKAAELVFPSGVTAEIASARQERYSRSGGRVHYSPATIQEDLRCRDFTIHSIALSLNPASLGLLLDPTNGLADLERKELRAVHNYIFFDDPVRLLRLIRFRVRLGFTVEERTQQQYRNAREAGMETRIPPRRLFEQLRALTSEPSPGDVLAALEQENLLSLFCPVLADAKLCQQGLAKLQKARQLVPFGVDFRPDNFALVMYFLTEKMTPKEKAALVKANAMHKGEVEAWQKLDVRSRKLERELKSAKLQKPSQIYRVLAEAPGDQIVYLLLRSSQRLVQDRARNFLQKYLPAAQEVTEQDVIAAGAEPGTAKFKKLREEMISARLDGRGRKPATVLPPQEEPAPAPKPR